MVCPWYLCWKDAEPRLSACMGRWNHQLNSRVGRERVKTHEKNINLAIYVVQHMLDLQYGAKELQQVEKSRSQLV